MFWNTNSYTIQFKKSKKKKKEKKKLPVSGGARGKSDEIISKHVKLTRKNIFLFSDMAKLA